MSAPGYHLWTHRNNNQLSLCANKTRQIHASFLLTYVLHYDKLIRGKTRRHKVLQSVKNTNAEMAPHQINIHTYWRTLKHKSRWTLIYLSYQSNVWMQLLNQCFFLLFPTLCYSQDIKTDMNLIKKWPIVSNFMRSVKICDVCMLYRK